MKVSPPTQSARERKKAFYERYVFFSITISNFMNSCVISILLSFIFPISVNRSKIYPSIQYLSIYPISIHISIYLYIRYPSIYPSIYDFSIHLSNIYPLSIYQLSIYLIFIHLSNIISIHLSNILYLPINLILL